MKFNFLAVSARLVFSLTLIFQTAEAQTARKVPAEEARLIVQLVKELNQTGWHSEGDVYFRLKIGKTEYLGELESGKIVKQSAAKIAGGGICGNYAAVSIGPLDKNKRETSQGSGQLLKLSKGKWEKVALAEGDYACQKLSGVSAPVIRCLKVECN